MPSKTPDDAELFGPVLRELRLAAGLTQEELAERAEVSARAIGGLERGRILRPQRKTVALLSRALELSAPDAARLAEAARPARAVRNQAADAAAHDGAADDGSPAGTGR